MGQVRFIHALYSMNIIIIYFILCIDILESLQL